MAAQQKPSDKGDKRNSTRRNGKAPKRALSLVNDQGVPKIGPNGVRNWGKGAASGKSVLGYSVARVSAMAKQHGISRGQMVDILRDERDEKKLHRKMKRLSLTHGDNRSSVVDMRRELARCLP